MEREEDGSLAGRSGCEAPMEREEDGSLAGRSGCEAPMEREEDGSLAGRSGCEAPMEGEEDWSLAGRSGCEAPMEGEEDDDGSSAASGLDVVDRLTFLEQRMQMQEDEIQLLKMTLADVLKRLLLSEEQGGPSGARRTPGAKARRPVSLLLPPRNPAVSPHAAALKKSPTAPSSAAGRNYSSSPTPSKSSVRETGAKTRPPSAASTCKTATDSSSHTSKEPPGTVGTRRVTHCKVTMQIYLSPQARRTGSSERAPTTTSFFTTSSTTSSTTTGGTSSNNSSGSGSAGAPPPPVPPGAPGHRAARSGAPKPDRGRTTPGFPLQTPGGGGGQRETSYKKSPLAPPSQYFQICY
ncbi:hypothetical protein NHX12_026141 [Muraenolepis orangiensis]|uniref:Echinoderm microtubule-associated protein-like 1 n=1 Tax=Muraenolepis orangiensis TaxID=630683 RepID=A0A9Q0EJS8_9TELE|nr:hypothetical protein NHX12_026141 [Muraenolepis orangiensis]